MNQGKLYDVSLTISAGIPIWPGNPQLALDSVKTIAQGASSNLSLLHIGTHTATHVDAPSHFIEGAPGVDNIPPEVLVGHARLLQLPEVHHIDRQVLRKLDLTGVTRILLGTRNSVLLKQAQLDMDYAFVSADAAQYLVDIGIKLVGIDYLSIEQYQKEGHPAHHILLGAGVVIIEGLYLADVPPGDYELMCLPLKLRDADGAPARVFLRELSGT
jgi:arylformamidase